MDVPIKDPPDQRVGVEIDHDALDEKNGNQRRTAYVFPCPHCGIRIQVFEHEIACTIFRHAYMKNTKNQIGPHTSKEQCDNFVANNQVVGCARPFRFIRASGSEPAHVIPCGYI